MQSVSSRIWTHVAVSISYDDNHYTTGTSCYVIDGRYIESWSVARFGDLLVEVSVSMYRRKGIVDVIEGAPA